jgi:serine/threonine-protein kinase RsbW
MGTPQAAADGADVVHRWPCTNQTVQRARHELSIALDAWDMPQLRDTALLVLSELVTNAVRHASHPADRPIETRFRRLPNDRVRIEVSDADERRPVPREVSEMDEAGRGLALVDAMTERWGVRYQDGEGKSVWAVVSCGSESASSQATLSQQGGVTAASAHRMSNRM